MDSPADLRSWVFSRHTNFRCTCQVLGRNSSTAIKPATCEKKPVCAPRSWHDPAEITAEAARLPISHTALTALTELSLEDALRIVQRMHTRFTRQGTVLVQKGLSGSNTMLLILHRKKVIEDEDMKKSDSLPLGVVGPCHIFGEMDLLDGEPRSATCRAHTDMPVAVLTKINRPLLELKIAGMDTPGHPERCCRPGQFLDVLIAGVRQG